MFLTQDCLDFLTNKKNQATNSTEINYLNKLIKALLLDNKLTEELLSYMIKEQGLEVRNFYEYLRKQYNNRRSKLYKNLVREDFLDQNVSEKVIVLTSLLQQITLHCKHLDSKRAQDSFLKQSRADEILESLHSYFSAGNEEYINQVLKLIQIDLKVIEMMAGTRQRDLH